MADRRIRTGVVGVGRMGRHHTRIYSSNPQSELMGVFDIHSEKARAVADEYHTKAYPSLESLLNDVEAITISVPTSIHAQICSVAFPKGIHALIEKPIAGTYMDSRKIVDIATKFNIITMVGHVERFNPAFQKLLQIAGAKRPLVIDAFRIGPHIERATDVSVVLDLMIHDLDLVSALAGLNIESLSARGKKLYAPTFDYVAAQLSLKEGTLANLIASKISPYRERRLVATWGEYSYEVNFMNSTLTKRRIDPSSDPTRPEILEEQLEVIPGEPLAKEVELFLGSVASHKPTALSSELGLKVLKTAMEIEQVVSRGGTAES